LNLVAGSTSASTYGSVLVKDGTSSHTTRLSIDESTVAVSNPIVITEEDTSANAVTDVMTLKHTMESGSTAASGIGAGLSLWLENGNGIVAESGKIELALTSASNGAETSTLSFKTRNAGTVAEAASLDHTGLLSVIGGLTVGSTITLTSAQTVTTSTGDLTIASGGADGNILVTPDATTSSSPGYVGVGGKNTVSRRFSTSSEPKAMLHVSGASSDPMTTATLPIATTLVVEEDADAAIAIVSGATNTGSIYFSAQQGTGTGTKGGNDGFVQFSHSTAAAPYQYLSFGVGSYDGTSHSDALEHMRIDHEGKVGIGSLNSDSAATLNPPLAPLHVRNRPADNFDGLDTGTTKGQGKSGYLMELVEATDSVVQVVGQSTGNHAASVVLSSKPTSATDTDPVAHWVMTHRGDTTGTAKLNGALTIDWINTASGISGTNLETGSLANSIITVSTDGEVGIGGPPIASKTLTINGPVEATSFAIIGGSGIGSSTDTYFNQATPSSAGIYYDTAKLAIGHELPTQLLHLKGTTETILLVEGGTTSGSAASIQLQGSGSGNARIRYTNALEWTDTATTPGNTWMYLSALGKLGIGTISPLGFLHTSLEAGQTEPAATAVNANGAVVISGNYGNLDLLSRDTGATTASSIGFGRYSNAAGGAMILSKMGLVTKADTTGGNLLSRLSFTYGTDRSPASNAELVSFTRGGNVGIGFTEPPAQLSVATDIFLAAVSSCTH
jgi:hypothetical protein